MKKKTKVKDKKEFKKKIKEIVTNKFVIYVFIIAVILLAFTIYRSATTGITWDEAFTYQNYVKRNPFHAFRGLFINGPRNGVYTGDTVIANNHMLNTFLISLFTKTIGVTFNILMIRMPNIIFYFIFFIIAGLLSNKYKHKYLCFNILAFNYGIHEYFSLARGYGMACTLVLIALYMLKLWMDNQSNYKNLNICYLILAISCYASTTCLLIFATILLLTQFIILFKKGIKENINYVRKSLLFIIPITIMTILIILFHFHVSNDGFNLYGGENGFFKDTLLSLFSHYGIKHCIEAICITFTGIMVLIVLIKRELFKNPLIYISLIYFVLLIVLTLINKQLWFRDRLLIPAIPLILIPVYEIIDKVKINKYIMFILLIVTAIPFFMNLNLKITRDFGGDYEVRDAAYKAYRTKDNSIVQQYVHIYSLYYYRDEIYEKYGYDIFVGIERMY